jgi:excisionase family DNA binding protein
MTDNAHQDNRLDPAADRVLTSAEVAALFRVTPRVVAGWVKAGKLTSVSPGAQHRILEAEVRALLNGGQS